MIDRDELLARLRAAAAELSEAEQHAQRLRMRRDRLIVAGRDAGLTHQALADAARISQPAAVKAEARGRAQLR